ncbi:hypothetical protein SAMN05421539_1036 [Jannaschia seohaensis]|uniref:Uncharacterized protein n=1 Tax=Jannaschia seohaensis TaxID=475081 RepID=A0A2Y9AJF3_9RHOB|nr:hypothetical protein BCF38_1036 [Jannaschia seohaensis]SSA44176.1 hypothetical protein SAMN05421539_1036 [Jannaschia seohaensis]
MPADRGYGPGCRSSCKAAFRAGGPRNCVAVSWPETSIPVLVEEPDEPVMRRSDGRRLAGLGVSQNPDLPFQDRTTSLPESRDNFAKKNRKNRTRRARRHGQSHRHRIVGPHHRFCTSQCVFDEVRFRHVGKTLRIGGPARRRRRVGRFEHGIVRCPHSADQKCVWHISRWAKANGNVGLPLVEAHIGGLGFDFDRDPGRLPMKCSHSRCENKARKGWGRTDPDEPVRCVAEFPRRHPECALRVFHLLRVAQQALPFFGKPQCTVPSLEQRQADRLLKCLGAATDRCRVYGEFPCQRGQRARPARSQKKPDVIPGKSFQSHSCINPDIL